MKKLKSFVFITSILGGMLLSGCSTPGGLHKKLQRSVDTSASVEMEELKDDFARGASMVGKSVSIGEVATLTFAKGSGTSNPAFYQDSNTGTTGSAVRLYAKNTMTLTANTNYAVSSYSLKFGSQKSGTIRSDYKSGNISSESVVEITEEDGIESVKFTAGDKGQIHVISVTINYISTGEAGPTIYTLSFDAGGFASGTKASVEYEEGTIVTVPGFDGFTLRDSGVEFAYWQADDEGQTHYVVGSSLTMTRNTKLTAMCNVIGVTTVSVTAGQLANQYGYQDSTVHTSIDLDTNINVHTTANEYNGRYHTYDGGQWRLYQKLTGDLTIQAAQGFVISKISVAYNNNNTGGVLLFEDTGDIYDGSELELNYLSSIHFNSGNSGEATNGQVRVTAFSVTYLPASMLKTVSFSAGAGTGAMESVEVAAGSTYTLPESTFIPAEGYEFKAWLVGEEEKGVGAEITVNDNIEITAIYQATSDLYLRSTMTDPAWKVDAEYKLIANTKERAEADYDYYLKEVIFLDGAEFKIAKADWSFEYNSDNLRNDYYVKGHEGDKNIVVIEEGIYDVYVDLNYHKVAVVQSAFDIFKQQDLNYTRDTLINLNSDSFKDVKEDNYFNQITVHRTTSFIDNALFMTSTDEAINSGYYTRKNENSGKNMYHYNMVGNASQAYEVDGEIENQRHDSSTTGVNDFFINGHYFNVLAEEFAVGFDYDMYEDHYYCGTNIADELFEDFLAFTAPLLVINDKVQFEFSGVAIQDLGGETQFKLFASSETSHIEGGSSLFSTATLTNIGTTEIQALQKYINQEIA